MTGEQANSNDRPDSVAEADVDEDLLPNVPSEDLEANGWSIRGIESEERARVTGFVVHAYEYRFEDTSLRESVRDAGGPDHLLRLFFGTRLAFTPSLNPIGVSMAESKVRSRSCEEFEDKLRSEGLKDVERRNQDELLVETGETADITTYDAVLPVEMDGERRDLPMEGWIAVWHSDQFVLAGGLHPSRPLSDVLDLPEGMYDPEAGREEIKSYIKRVV